MTQAGSSGHGESRMTLLLLGHSRVSTHPLTGANPAVPVALPSPQPRG